MDRFFRTTLMALAWALLLMGSSAYAGNVYVAFGDSITKGCCEDGEQGFPPLLAAILPEPNNTVFNEGINGASSRTGKDRIDDVLEMEEYREATHFLIQFGTNDARAVTSVSVDEYSNNMRNIIRAIEGAGKRPLLAKVPILYRGKDSMQPPCDLSSASAYEVNQRIREYNQVIDDLIADYNLEIAPGQPLTAPDFYSYFESTDTDAHGKSVEFSECVHPNHTGYQAMAQIWAAALGTQQQEGEPETHIYRYKTAIERITASDSFQPDGHLYFDVGANERWSFEALLWIKTTDATGDFRFLWRGPNGSDVRSNVVAYEGNRIANQANQLTMNTIWSVDYAQAVTIQPIYIKGVFSTRETAGRIRLEWCQREPSGTTSVYFPSYLDAKRVQ